MKKGGELKISSILRLYPMSKEAFLLHQPRTNTLECTVTTNLTIPDLPPCPICHGPAVFQTRVSPQTAFWSFTHRHFKHTTRPASRN